MAGPDDDLTTEQREIAEAGASSRTLVTAGPGTGKTHTLVARLAALIQAHELDPGQEILVLSFSRAAVREIRDRLRSYEGAASYVAARTFDSFATRVLADEDPDGAWQRLGYDDRILAATQLLHDCRFDDGPLSELRHVVVDEAQDLVGVRAEFVKSILDRSDAGFTIFGDPAQGIYNFQLEGAARQKGSAALYEWLRWRFKNDLVEIGLVENFRARTDAARAALSFGPQLNEQQPDFPRIEQALESVLMSAPTVGDIETAIPVLRDQRIPTAILTRTNGDALLISNTLFEHGIPHRLQQRATDRVVGRWVADALGILTQRQISKATVMRELGEVPLPPGLSSSDAWRLLKRLDRRDRRRSDDLDLVAVADRLRVGDVPDELTAIPPSPLVVSTIHRAKGLEFDRVIIAQSQHPAEEDPTVQAEETRTLFVALTRPRDQLLHMSGPDSRLLTNWGTADARWYRRGWKNWQRFGIEVRGDDTHRDDPAGAIVIDEEPARVQNYLREKVLPGDPVHLHRKVGWVDGDERTFYAIVHGDQPVGITSARFGGALFSLLKINRKWDVSWPAAIAGLHVESIDTVAGTEASGLRAGLGPSAIWLRVRVVGLGRFVFEKKG
jgi:superfamily I DNA/RNA helicase